MPNMNADNKRTGKKQEAWLLAMEGKKTDTVRQRQHQGKKE